MIAYDLKCRRDHHFEGWFEDESAYLSQKRKNMVACPICNDTDVDRIPSAFAIKSTRPAPPARRDMDELSRLGRQIVQYVEKNFDDVGTDFAKEALKIHYGVSEPRNIRGSSSREEEKMLKQEGIQFFKFPMPAPSEENEET